MESPLHNGTATDSDSDPLSADGLARAPSTPSSPPLPSPRAGGLDMLLASTEESPRRGSAGRSSRINYSGRTMTDQPKTTLGAGKLMHRWMLGTVNKKDWTPETFGCPIKTVEELWQHLNLVRHPSCIGEGNVFLFKEGVSPKWELPVFTNKEASGRIVINISDKNNNTERLCDCCWYYIILSMIGCSGFALGHEDSIQGASCTVRPGRQNLGMTGRLEVWIATFKASDCESIRAAFEADFWNALPLIEQAVCDGSTGHKYDPNSVKTVVRFLSEPTRPTRR